VVVTWGGDVGAVMGVRKINFQYLIVSNVSASFGVSTTCVDPESTLRRRVTK
jgi:hypothetical protein